MRLLIVEDETRIAELIQGALARVGFAVDAAGLCGDVHACKAPAWNSCSDVWVGLCQSFFSKKSCSSSDRGMGQTQSRSPCSTFWVFFLMIRQPPRSTPYAASDTSCPKAAHECRSAQVA